MCRAWRVSASAPASTCSTAMTTETSQSVGSVSWTLRSAASEVRADVEAAGHELAAP